MKSVQETAQQLRGILDSNSASSPPGPLLSLFESILESIHETGLRRKVNRRLNPRFELPRITTVIVPNVQWTSEMVP